MNAWEFRLPDLGEGLHEAEFVAWHVGVGDHVVVDQPLLSVETDKAVVEVPSPRSGYIAALHASPGDVLEIGALLVEFSEAAVDRGAIVGDLERGENAAATAYAPSLSTTSAVGVSAVPAARRLAEELDIDLASVTGSGPEGAVTASDVRAAALLTSDPQKLRRVRRTMLKKMTRAGREVVAATVMDEADVDGWAAGTDVTIRLIRAISSACAAVPSLNAWFDAESETRTLHRQVNVAIALESDDGLFAPVLQDVGDLEEASLRQALEEIKREVAARSIPQTAMTGATITLSNFGMFGGRFAELVVSPPQVAIVGAGRIARRVIARGDETVIHRLLPLSLSFDHRVVTGVESLRFLAALIDALEKP